MFPLLLPAEDKRPPRRRPAIASLSHTRLLLNQAYSGFNNASNGDLIESYVYEINALHARYNYLLRRVKELEGAG